MKYINISTIIFKSHLIHHEALGTSLCLAPSSLIMTWEKISITWMMRIRFRIRMTTSMAEDQGEEGQHHQDKDKDGLETVLLC